MPDKDILAKRICSTPKTSQWHLLAAEVAASNEVQLRSLQSLQGRLREVSAEHHEAPGMVPPTPW